MKIDISACHGYCRGDYPAEMIPFLRQVSEIFGTEIKAFDCAFEQESEFDSPLNEREAWNHVRTKLQNGQKSILLVPDDTHLGNSETDVTELIKIVASIPGCRVLTLSELEKALSEEESSGRHSAAIPSDNEEQNGSSSQSREGEKDPHDKASDSKLESSNASKLTQKPDKQLSGLRDKLSLAKAGDTPSFETTPGSLEPIETANQQVLAGVSESGLAEDRATSPDTATKNDELNLGHNPNAPDNLGDSKKWDGPDGGQVETTSLKPAEFNATPSREVNSANQSEPKEIELVRREEQLDTAPDQECSYAGQSDDTTALTNSNQAQSKDRRPILESEPDSGSADGERGERVVLETLKDDPGKTPDSEGDQSGPEAQTDSSSRAESGHEQLNDYERPTETERGRNFKDVHPEIELHKKLDDKIEIRVPKKLKEFNKRKYQKRGQLETITRDFWAGYDPARSIEIYEIRKLTAQIAHCGNNINQIAKALNTANLEGDVIDLIVLSKLLEKIWQDLEDLANEGTRDAS